MFCVRLSDVDQDPWAPSTLKRSRRRSRRSRNPYSNCGLDKFASVLADLGERRDKIVARMSQGQQQLLLVRFMHSNAHDWVPIIVRLRETKQKEKTQLARAGVHGQGRQGREVKKAIERSRSGLLGNKDIVPSSQLPTPKPDPGQRMKRGLSWNVMAGAGTKRGRPSHDLVLVMILILLCLLISGRSFAIFATSGCWYLGPALRGDQREAVTEPKEYGRRMSGKGLGGDFRSSQSKMGAPSPRYHGRER